MFPLPAVSGRSDDRRDGIFLRVLAKEMIMGLEALSDDGGRVRCGGFHGRARGSAACNVRGGGQEGPWRESVSSSNRSMVKGSGDRDRGSEGASFDLSFEFPRLRDYTSTEVGATGCE